MITILNLYLLTALFVIALMFSFCLAHDNFIKHIKKYYHEKKYRNIKIFFKIAKEYTILPFMILLHITILLAYFSIKCRIPNNLTNTYTIKYSNEIISLNDEHINSFYIVSDNNYYYIMKKTSDGGYVKEKIDINDSVIYINNDITPKIELYTVKQEWFIFYQNIEKYKIFIPENNISNIFKINLE